MFCIVAPELACNQVELVHATVPLMVPGYVTYSRCVSSINPDYDCMDSDFYYKWNTVVKEFDI